MNVHEIALGGLLHDIGKFMQRTYAPGEGLSPQSQGMAPYICPVTRDGRSTHLHVLYTNEFVESLRFLPNRIDRATVANLASYHHRPDTREQKIIAKADRLSSGMEREDDPEQQGGYARFRQTPLLSVAARLTREDSGQDGVYGFRLEPLSPESAFPQIVRTERDLTPDYQALWHLFQNSWNSNVCSHQFGFLARALSVLEHFTWCIPSATNVVPDISLYDHLRTTAAIAVCLHETPDSEQVPFLLVTGDLTGIQHYIFDLREGAGGHARRLRARSFNIAAYAELITTRILTKLELPPTQVILQAGGKFHLLLPNSPTVHEALDAVTMEAANWLAEESSGELGLALARVPADAEALGSFSKTLELAHQALREERNREGRLELLTHEGWNEERFVRPMPDVQDGLCQCCNRHGARTRFEDNQELRICTHCDDEEDTGRKLPKRRYLALYANHSGEYPGPTGSFSLLDRSDLAKSRDAAVVLDFEGFHDTGSSEVPLAGRPWARYVPTTKEGDVQTFEEIANEARGRKVLGWLKLDVDDLGWIFSEGLKGSAKDRTSISRVATLSRTLDLFFRAHVNQLLSADFPNVYLVYSGGDDMLAVGPWDQLFHLAARIRQDFRRFTGANPAWKLSAGISLSTTHTPVLAAVQEVEALLESSKSTSGTGAVPWPSAVTTTDGPPQKNRITALGVSMPWADFPTVMEQAQRLADWLQDGTLRTRQVRRLLSYAELHRQYQRTGDTQYFRYVPLLVYDLRRNWKEESNAEKQAKTWVAQLAAPHAVQMKTLHFVCQYALYANREADAETGKGVAEWT